jgi:hypothetical protein
LDEEEQKGNDSDEVLEMDANNEERKVSWLEMMLLHSQDSWERYLEMKGGNIFSLEIEVEEKKEEEEEGDGWFYVGQDKES